MRGVQALYEESSPVSLRSFAEHIQYLLWKYEQNYQQTDLDDFFSALSLPSVHH